MFSLKVALNQTFLALTCHLIVCDTLVVTRLNVTNRFSPHGGGFTKNLVPRHVLLEAKMYNRAICSEDFPVTILHKTFKGIKFYTNL